jgi:hypothetical protein
MFLVPAGFFQVDVSRLPTLQDAVQTYDYTRMALS